MDESFADDKEVKNKKGFSLVDEKENHKNCDQNGKKVKKGIDTMIICENGVEEASQKWPQLDK